jgi:hypothetical protein
MSTDFGWAALGFVTGQASVLPRFRRQITLTNFKVHVTVHRDKFLTIKRTRCTNFSNLFLEWNSTCFGQFLCPIIRSFSLYIQQWYTSYIFSDNLQAVSKPVWHIPLLYVQWKTSDDGQSNCLKHLQNYSKHKFEKLVHLVGFVVRNPNQCLSSSFFLHFL